MCETMWNEFSEVNDLSHALWPEPVLYISDFWAKFHESSQSDDERCSRRLIFAAVGTRRGRPVAL